MSKFDIFELPRCQYQCLASSLVAHSTSVGQSFVNTKRCLLHRCFKTRYGCDQLPAAKLFNDSINMTALFNRQLALRSFGLFVTPTISSLDLRLPCYRNDEHVLSLVVVKRLLSRNRLVATLHCEIHPPLRLPQTLPEKAQS